MYSSDGKRLVNRVLANKERTIGSHVVLGLNTVYDANLDGSASPKTHNRYHTPYILDEIPVANSTVITGAAGDEIVFSGQANAAKRYIANNIGLYSLRSAGATRSSRTLANVINSTWTNDINPANLTRPTGTTEFTDDGVLQLAKTFTASFTERVSLFENTTNDILAFPLYFVNNDTTMTPAPENSVITVRIRYTVSGVEKYCEYTNTVNIASGKWRFANDPVRNEIASVGTIAKPNPFVWQKRLSATSSTSAGTTAQTMIDNGANIIGINITYTGGTGSFVRFGSLKITPDFDADESRTCVAFRKLATPLHKTSSEVYVNAEYRVLGVV